MNLFKKLSAISITLFLAGTVFPLFAQVDLYPSGHVTASAYVIPTRELPLDLNAAGLRGAFNLDGYLGDAQLRLSLELYSNIAGIADEKAYGDDWYYPGAYEGSWNDQTLFSADLKEAWIGFALGDFDLNLGKQILTWGQADGTNPTDNINPQYIGTRSLSGSMEKKMGVPMVNLVYYLSGIDGNIQGVFMPLASYNQMPSLGDYISVETPTLDLKNMEGGARILLYPGAVSLSLSYLTILDRYPTDAIKITTIPVTAPSVLGYNRQHIAGFVVHVPGPFSIRVVLANDWPVIADPLAAADYIVLGFILRKVIFDEQVFGVVGKPLMDPHVGSISHRNIVPKPFMA